MLTDKQIVDAVIMCESRGFGCLGCPRAPDGHAQCMTDGFEAAVRIIRVARKRIETLKLDISKKEDIMRKRTVRKIAAELLVNNPKKVKALLALPTPEREGNKNTPKVWRPWRCTEGRWEGCLTSDGLTYWFSGMRVASGLGKEVIKEIHTIETLKLDISKTKGVKP